MIEFKDKIDIKSKINNGESIVLELGAGNRRRPNRLNIDIVDLPDTDIVADLTKGLPFLPDNSVDAIHATSFLEHIANLELLMTEIYRVLKPDGLLYAFVPHFSNPYYYSDYTHKTPFGLYTFSYFSKSNYPFHRKVPKFYNDCNFKITSIKLIFKSKLLTKIINSRYRLLEFYEAHFSRLLSCYGLDTTLKAIKNESISS